MKVIMDNLQFYKINFLGNPEMINIFRNMSQSSQTKYNKNIEETCGIMMKIPNIILLDFSQYLEKFVVIKQPDENRFKSKSIKNEEKQFINICRLFSEISKFLKSVFEVYSILVKQVDDMVIGKNNFNQVVQFLSRTRYNLSYLINTAKNAFANMNSDLKSFNKFQSSIKRDVDQDMVNKLNNDGSKRKPPLPKITNIRQGNSERRDPTYKKEVVFKTTEYNDKISRLNIILNNKGDDLNDSAEIKKRLNKKSHHESSLVFII
jgi:hypothetical protein